MKLHSIMLSLVLVAAATTASAQRNGGGRPDAQRQGENLTEIYTAQASRLAKQMDLKKDKKELFSVLFLDYQNARHNAVNPKGGDQESEEARVDFDNLTDEEATELIQKNFDRQERQLQVDKDYLPKFLEILTPAQAARVYLATGGRQGGRDMRGMRGGPGGFGGGPGGFGGGPGGGPGF